MGDRAQRAVLDIAISFARRCPSSSGHAILWRTIVSASLCGSLFVRPSGFMQALLW